MAERSLTPLVPVFSASRESDMRLFMRLTDPIARLCYWIEDRF